MPVGMLLPLVTLEVDLRVREELLELPNLLPARLELLPRAALRLHGGRETEAVSMRDAGRV